MKMKFALYPLALVFLCCTACSGGEKTGEGNGKTDDNKLTLTPQFKAGDKQVFKMTMVEDFSAEEGPQGPWAMHNTTNMVWDNVVENATDGTAQIKGVYRKVRFDFEVPEMEGKQSWDSDSIGKNPEMDAMFQHMPGIEITYAVDKSGNVSGMQNANPLLLHMLPDSGAYTGNDWLAESMGIDAIYPGKPVDVGDTWTRTWEQASFLPVSVAFTYTLKERKDGMARIEVDGKVSPHPNSFPTNEMGNEIDYELTGTISGHYMVHEANGMLASNELKQDLAGTCSMTPPGGEAFTFPVKIKKAISATYEYN